MRRTLAIIVLAIALVLVRVVPVCGDAFAVYINGTAAEFSHAPIVNAGQVYIEIKELFGLVGRYTTWNSDKGVFFGTLGQSSYVYDPVGNVLKAAGQMYYLKQPPLQVMGNTYVSAQEFAEPLNFKVYLDESKVELYGDLVPNPKLSGFPHYEIEAIYAEGKIYGHQKVTLVNLRNRSVRDVLFVLPAPSINPQSETKIYTVTIDGVPVEFQVGETHLRVVLPHSLEPMEQCSLEISFDTLVPQGPSRLGYTQDCAVLSCWYPVVSLDESVPVYTGFGEPYSFLSGTYSVNFKVEKGMQVFSGLTMSEKKDDGEKISYWFSSSLPIREAAFVVGSFDTKSCSAGSTTIHYAYHNYRPGVNDYASKAVKLFGQWWGEYPYPSLTLIEVPLEDLHGMEYGGLILLSTINQHDPFIVVHEVAHQWWQGLVGNNQETEAWIDEGLANYSTLLFFEKRFGYSDYCSRIRSMQAQAGNDFSKLRCSLQDFPSKEEYKRNAYVRGALLWHEVRHQAGRDKLLDFLRSIQDHYKFGKITTEEIVFLLHDAFPGGTQL